MPRELLHPVGDGSDDWKLEELLELRLRAAVGEGKQIVQVSGNDLEDDDVKLLVRMLNETESAARGRLQAARKAQAAAERARAETLVPEFMAFQPDALTDREELASPEQPMLSLTILQPCGPVVDVLPFVSAAVLRRTLWR